MQKGISRDELADGDAHNLAYRNGAIDLVSDFSILHHLPNPSRAIREMLRVARKAIFILDANIFEIGGPHSRLLNQLLRTTKFWPIVNFVRTGGRGYSVTDNDEVWYRYSVFDDSLLLNLYTLRKACIS
jgi:ubiquinone/menaquinone biosynthesis C-methylase UbiE